MNEFRWILSGFILLIIWGNVYGQTLHLVTENYPPLNMSLDGGDSANEDQITGSSTEIVQELFKRARINYTLQLYPWKRAYWLAENKLNHAVYSTARTPAREELFKWVGPLAINNWVFFAKKERRIKIKHLEDAKKYRIGGYAGDAIAIYLQGEGFHLDLSEADHINAYLISKDRIDLWATGHLLGPYYAKRQGILGLEEVHIFNEIALLLAFNNATSSKLINKLNKIIRQMEKDGTIKAINKRYR